MCVRSHRPRLAFIQLHLPVGMGSSRLIRREDSKGPANMNLFALEVVATVTTQLPLFIPPPATAQDHLVVLCKCCISGVRWSAGFCGQTVRCGDKTEKEPPVNLQPAC